MTTARRIGTLTLAMAALAAAAALAQEKPTLAPVDYGRWETLGASRLSPDGRWLAYEVRRVDEENELRVRALDEDSARVVPFGTGAEFSADALWLAWRVGLPPEPKRKKGDRPAVGLLDARARSDTTFAGVESFAFSEDGAYLALYRPTEHADDYEGEESGDLVVRTLATGQEMPLGNVGQWAWSPSGHLLALTVVTATGSGGAVQLFDPASGTLRVLDRGEDAYARLAWREDEDELAVLRARTDSAFAEDTHVVLLWRDLARGATPARVFDPAAQGLAADLRVADHFAPAWSADGRTLFFGVRPRDRADSAEAGPEADSAAAAPAEEEDAEEEEEDEEEPSDVEIWHARDLRIIPMQQAQEERDLERTLLYAWHVDEGRFVQLGTGLMTEAELLEGGRWVIEADETPYARDVMFGRPWADLYRVDVRTGERARVLEKVRYWWADGPEGRWILFFQGEDWWSLDVASGARANLTEALDGDFADRAYDYPVTQLPPVGFRPLGWLAGEAAVLLRDRWDVWAVRPDGSGGARLTDGAAEEIEHGVVQLDPEADAFDPAEPLYLSLFGDRSKRSGYGRVRLRERGGRFEPAGPAERLVWEDASLRGLAKAERADVYAWASQRFDDSPDVFVGGPELAGARQVTRTNPFQADYAWGRSGVVDFTSRAGVPLQATLLYPAGWVQGRTYPMIVYTYELLSDGVHRYEVPSERDYYDFQAWTQEGYFVLQPDIVYRPRDPGLSAVDAVVPAVAKIVEMGLVDPERVGLIGHSWGGYQATFIPTQTDIFAASVAGAPLTDFLSFAGAIHWRPGMPEFGHWETGQARMDVPPWEDFEAHVRNSPAAHIQSLETPMLMVHGDDDGTVDFSQGVEFYNYARRAGKEFVLLVYPGEDHGLRQKKNQVDYHRRILEWFGHYLKGEPAAPWIREGVSWLARKKEISQ